MEARDLKELNLMLRNSFGNIKKDMNGLKEEISLIKNSQSMSDSEIKDNLIEIRNTAATVDQINILKIKLNSVREKVDSFSKEVSNLHKENKALSKNIVKKNEVVKIRDDFQKQFFNFFDETGARLEQLRKEVKITKQKEESMLDKEEFNNFVGSLNSEMDYLRKAIEKTYNLKDTITKKELDSKTHALKNKLVEVNRKLEQQNKDALLLSKRFSETKNDVNKFSDSVKSNFNTLNLNIEKRVSENQVKILIDDVNHEFEKLKNEISKIKEINTNIKDLKKGVREIRRTVALDEEVEILQNQIDDLKTKSINGNEITKMLGDIKKSEKQYRSDIKTINKTEKIVKREILKKSKKPFSKTLFFANSFIVLSFASLVGAMVSFFLGQLDYMDAFSVSAVIWFLIGILLRIFVVARRN